MAVTNAVDAAAAAQSSGAPAAEARLERNLKIIVTVLAVLLFVGLAAVIGRIIYLASLPAAQPPPEAMAGAPIAPAFSLALPAGAEVRSMALSGDRLAVHYEAAGTQGIAVIDLRTGRPAASIGIERTGPAK
jgi:hypothetical protein